MSLQKENDLDQPQSEEQKEDNMSDKELQGEEQLEESKDQVEQISIADQILRDQNIPFTIVEEQSKSEKRNGRKPKVNKEGAEEKAIKVNTKAQKLFKNIILYGEILDLTDLKDFIMEKKPSFQIVQLSVQLLLDEESNTRQMFLKHLSAIFKVIIENNLPRLVIRVLLDYVEKFKSTQEFDIQSYQKNRIHDLWNRFPSDDLSKFITIFELQLVIPERDMNHHLTKLLKSNKMESALELFKTLNSSNPQIYDIIHSISDSYNCSLAAEVVLRLGFPIEDFKNLKDLMNQNYVRYLQKTYTWYHCEEMLTGNPKFLQMLVKMYYPKTKKYEALSIVVRHDLLKHIDDKKLSKQISNDLSDNFKILNNILNSNDDFVPTDLIINKDINKDVYLTNQELGVTEQQTHFIFDDDSELFAIVSDKLKNSTITGIDSEFLSSTCKFDQKGTTLQIVQISNGTENFIFDMVSLKESTKLKELMIFYLESQSILKLGLSVKGDITLLCKSLNLKDRSIKNVLDIGSVHKMITKESNQRGLAFLTEHYLKKKLSKSDQCSNWSIRPLRRAQLHYSALDALACIRIYEKMGELISQEEIQFKLKSKKGDVYVEKV